jgi:hypothetical protein
VKPDLIPIDPRNPATIVMYILMSAAGAATSIVYGGQAFQLIKEIRRLK